MEDAPDRPLRDVVVLWGTAVLAAVVFLIGYTVVHVVAGWEAVGFDPLAQVPLYLLVLVAVVPLAARLRGGPGLGLDLVVPARRWWPVAVGALCAHMVGLLAFGALLSLRSDAGGVSFVVRWGEAGTGTVLRGVLLAVVLGPLVEEVLFRGVLQRAMTVRFGFRVALPITAVLFALWHLPEMGPAHLTAGLLYGWAHHRSGSLWIAIALHAASNAVAITGRWLMTGSL